MRFGVAGSHARPDGSSSPVSPLILIIGGPQGRRSRPYSISRESAEASSSKWRACKAKNTSTASTNTRRSWVVNSVQVGRPPGSVRSLPCQYASSRRRTRSIRISRASPWNRKNTR